MRRLTPHLARHLCLGLLIAATGCGIASTAANIAINRALEELDDVIDDAINGGDDDLPPIPTLAPNGVVAIVVGTGERSLVSDEEFIDPRAAVLDGGRVLVWDESVAVLFAVDVAGGSRTVLADAETGNGPLLNSVRAMALDADLGRVVVVDVAMDGDVALVAVDPATGDRSALPEATLTTPTHLTIEGGRAYVVDTDLGAILAVDLDTGATSVLADATQGLGPPFDALGPIVMNRGDGRLLVLDTGLRALFAVDPENGNREIVASDVIGSGPPLGGPGAMTFDALQATVFIAQDPPPLEQLLGVSLPGGNRTLVSGGGAGSGPHISYVAAAMLEPSGQRVLVLNRLDP